SAFFKASSVWPRSGFSPMAAASRASSVSVLGSAIIVSLLQEQRGAVGRWFPQRKRPTDFSAGPHSRASRCLRRILVGRGQKAPPSRPDAALLLPEQLVPAALLAGLPSAPVIGVRADQRHDGRGLGEDHLFVGGLDLAPGGGFFQRRGRAGAVAHVGDRDLDRIAVQ